MGALTPYFFSNIGNQNVEGGWQRAVANILDFSGGSTFTTMNASEATGATSGGQTLAEIAGGVTKVEEPVTPTIEDPAIAQAAASEEARQEEMRKRRLRTKTLLSDQEAIGQATVGTKVLLGG
jgi:hypothetical protein